jgi:hypothetical protein
MPAGVSNLAVAPAAPLQMAPMMGTLGAGGLGAAHGARVALKRGFATAQPEANDKSQRAEPSAAPPPPVKAAEKDERRIADADEGRADRPARRSAHHELVVSVSATDLSSPEKLRAAIEARLTGRTWRSLAKGLFVLRLHVDPAGKVIGVELVSGDPTLGADLVTALKGLASASKGTSPKATLLVTIRLSPN